MSSAVLGQPQPAPPFICLSLFFCLNYTLLLSSQRPMIARFFCRAELVASSQSQIGILDLNIADFNRAQPHNKIGKLQCSLQTGIP